ncbi:hypothetical protein KP509_03G010000 [Ceratopteris richardii]|uniref:K Homology domain-containing protein n=1 Tax=Ceratopteris richardii TaxID=49495 RepID=A0A8T2V1C4_CERRI|nr:hypothetical protein KP509_03G010000 [Ceratopteris richardii]
MLAMDSPRPPELTETCFPPSPPAAAAIPSSEHMKDVPAYIRFLISNAAAGSVIGKGGATINEFQSQSGARIQLSRNHEYFPGTSDRIIALHGTIQEVLTAFRLTLSKILNEAEKDAGHDNKSVKLIVPNAACGAIIGKGGATIKVLVLESKFLIGETICQAQEIAQLPLQAHQRVPNVLNYWCSSGFNRMQVLIQRGNFTIWWYVG